MITFQVTGSIHDERDQAGDVSRGVVHVDEYGLRRKLLVGDEDFILGGNSRCWPI